MANIRSQKKRIVRAQRERLENRRYTSTVKTCFRRLQSAVAGADAAAIDAEHFLDELPQHLGEPQVQTADL